MKHSGLTVFALFFGIALLDAVMRHNWLETALFVTLGGMFLWFDLRGRSTS